MLDVMMKAANPILEIKELDTSSGEFEGYGSTFGGEPDSYGDVVEKGAFLGSLAEHRAKGTMPKMFWSHRSSEPIGKWLEAKEDDRGLLLRGKLNMDVQRAREAASLIKEGDIDGLSIGYRLKRYEIDAETGVWFLKEVDLREVSIVSIGANENATITSVKAAKAATRFTDKLKAGDQLTEREFETVLKGALGFSNSEAERAVRIHFKRPGDPAPAAQEAHAFLTALLG